MRNCRVTRDSHCRVTRDSHCRVTRDSHCRVQDSHCRVTRGSHCKLQSPETAIAVTRDSHCKKQKTGTLQHQQNKVHCAITDCQCYTADNRQCYTAAHVRDWREWVLAGTCTRGLLAGTCTRGLGGIGAAHARAAYPCIAAQSQSAAPLQPDCSAKSECSDPCSLIAEQSDPCSRIAVQSAKSECGTPAHRSQATSQRGESLAAHDRVGCPGPGS